MKPSGISRRELIKQMGYCSLALACLPCLQPGEPGPVTFVDVAARAGIAFRHDNASSAEKYLIETMGSGCGWIDYDQNGLLDLYLVNGAATRVYTPKQPLRSALYRNNGDGTLPTSRPKLESEPKDFLEWAWLSAITTTTAFPTCSSRLRPLHPLPQQRRRHIHRCDFAGRRAELGTMGFERGMVRLRQRRQARPRHRELRRLVPRAQLLLRRPRPRHAQLLPSR